MTATKSNFRSLIEQVKHIRNNGNNNLPPLDNGVETHEAPIDSSTTDESTTENIKQEAESSDIPKFFPAKTFNQEFYNTIPQAKDRYSAYLQQRSQDSNNLYYYNMFTILSHFGETTKSLKVLSNLVENNFEDTQALRIVAFCIEHLLSDIQNTTMRTTLINKLIEIYEKILKSRPEEPNSYLHLALALSLRGNLNDLQRSVQLCQKVIQSKWNIRFEQGTSRVVTGN